MYRRLTLMRLVSILLCVVLFSTANASAAVGACSSTVGSDPTTSTTGGLSPAQCKLLLSGIQQFDLVDKGTGTCSSTSVGSDSDLVGADSYEKAYNFFRQKGLNEIQSAAVVANFKQESHLDPQAIEGGGRTKDPKSVGDLAWGIAQWDPGGKVVAVAETAKIDGPIYELATQLNIVYFEMTHSAPTGYQNVLGDMPKDSLSEATEFFRAHYESGTEGNRQQYAQEIYDAYKDNSTGGVAGINASCASSGSVNCDTSTAGDSTDYAFDVGRVSPVRQKVVCIAQGEYQRYKSGELKPGNDFFKYTHGVNEEWCAYFASWVYAQAGYPLVGGNGAVGQVLSIRDIGTKNDKFTYHSVDSYTPEPGDMAIHLYSNGGHHVNIVTSVNSHTKTITTIGGNEGSDSSGANTSSSVKETTWMSYSADSTVGYVSPKD